MNLIVQISSIFGQEEGGGGQKNPENLCTSLMDALGGPDVALQLLLIGALAPLAHQSVRIAMHRVV